jgi:hypothetical protein
VQAYPPQPPVYYPPAQVPAGYGQPYPAAPMAGAGTGLVGRLPVLGGIAAGVGFFLLWDTVSEMSGWSFLKFGFEQISMLDPNDSYFQQQIVVVVLMILLVLILIAALLGLLTLTGSRAVSAATAVVSVLALVELLAFYTYVVIMAEITLESLVSSTGIGWYLVVFGLLWMIFTPLFVPARRNKMITPSYY